MDILAQSDWSGWIQVLDYSSSPLRDVKVRIDASYFGAYNGSSVPHRLIGQRLTDDEGYAFFYADSRSEVVLTLIKDGYEGQTHLITIGDETLTRTTALTFYLQESAEGVTDNAWIYVQRDFRNRSLDISGQITAIGRNKVEVTTSYRETDALSRYHLTGDSLDRYPFTLYSGTDFSLVTSDDITLYIYLDSSLWRTITIEYDEEEKQFQFTGIPSEVSATVLNPLLAILLVLISFGFGFLIKNEKTSEIVFKTGGVGLSLVSTQFLWLTSIIVLSVLLKGIHKVISE